METQAQTHSGGGESLQGGSAGRRPLPSSLHQKLSALKWMQAPHLGSSSHWIIAPALWGQFLAWAPRRPQEEELCPALHELRQPGTRQPGRRACNKFQ